jgi:hypothetical protein
MAETNRARRTRVTNAHQKAAEEAQAKKPYQRGVLAAVEEFVVKQPGAHLWASDIMNATGFSKSQVQQAMGTLIRGGGNGSQITVIRPGNAWRYREPNPARITVPAKERVAVSAPIEEAGEPLINARCIRELPDGSLLLSLNGKDYHAKPLA